MSVHSHGLKRWRRVLVASLVGTVTAISAGSAGAVPGRPLHGMIGATAANAQASAGPAAGQVLGGFTSQGWPVVIVISKDARRIANIETGLDMSCVSGDSVTLPDGWVHLPIGTNGNVKTNLTIQPFAGNGFTITGGTDSFTGKLNRKRATFAGTWELQLSYAYSNGQTDQCDSGLVHFSAKL